MPSWFTKMMVMHLPDEEATSREDHLRRYDDGVGNSLHIVGGIINVAILNSVSNEPFGLITLIFWASIFLVSLFISGLVGLIFRTSICDDLGFYCIYGWGGDRATQNRWPGEIYDARMTMYAYTNGERVLREPRNDSEKELWNYWEKQQVAWRDIQVKSNSIGTFTAIICFYCLAIFFT